MGLITIKEEQTMGGNVADLMVALGSSIANFNKYDKVKIQTLLADDIVVHSRNPKNTLIENTKIGRDGKDHIVKQFEDHPTFTLLHVDIDLNGAKDGEATNATLTGIAKWKDDNDKGRDETLRFTFKCSFDTAEGWLFKDVSAVIV
jgi:hypothetical protein